MCCGGAWRANARRCTRGCEFRCICITAVPPGQAGSSGLPSWFVTRKDLGCQPVRYQIDNQ
jgi:hypothetical protein